MSLGFIKQYFGLPGRIYVLFLARIIAAMGSFVYSFLTLFMSNQLGYSDIKISRYLMLMMIITFPAVLMGGKVADKFSRKKTYVTLMGTGETLFLISGFLIDRPYVLVFIFSGVFFVNAASPVISAMMMDYTKPENRQESMSLVYLGFNFGYAIGPMIAGFLFVNYLPWIFWGNAIINAVSLILIMALIKDETPDESAPAGNVAGENGIADKQPARPQRGLLRQLAHDPVLVIVALFAISAAFSYSQIGYMLPLDMEEYFGIETGSKAYGVIWSLNGFSVFILTPLFVYVLKRNHPIFNLGIAGVLFALGFAGYAFTHNLVLMYLLVAVWTSGECVSASNTGVFIASHAPTEFRARYQSIYEIIQGIGRAIGPVLMGGFLSGHSVSQGWILCGCACLISALVYFTLYARGKR